MPNETIPESAKASAWKGLVSPTALEKPNNKPKRLADLDVESGTQQRAVDPDVVDTYAQLILDGVEFPRIRAIYDGNKFYVWDGFHRYFAYQKAGVEQVEIYYTRGTLRDAVFLSYAANKDHGFRRQPGTARKIIEQIFADKEWGKVPARAIAEHVGVGLRYVEKVAEDLRNKGDASALGGRATTRVVDRGGERREIPVRQGSSKTGGASSNGNGSAAHGEGGNGASHEEEPPAAPRVEVDKLGNALDRDDLVDVFSRAHVFRDYAKTLRGIKNEVVAAMGKDDKKIVDPLYAFLFRPGFVGNIDDNLNVLKIAEPYAVCPCHAQDDVSREGCKWCRGLGWVGKQAYDHATESMKATAKVGK